MDKRKYARGYLCKCYGTIFPTYKAKEDKDINRKLTKKEYEEIENYLYTLQLEKGYMQELGEHEEELRTKMGCVKDILNNKS